MLLPYAILFAVMTLFASLSPLLTFARLWQLKEWRFDRLREHLRENGWWRQLFGAVRPILVALLIVLSNSSDFWATDGVLIGLFVLTSLSLVQIVLGKQPKPVWTMKARALFCGAAALLAATSFFIIVLPEMTAATEWNHIAALSLLALPLLAPAFMVISGTLFRPIDMWLKSRTLRRATKIRLEHPHLTVIGITGSVGKTTMKELLAHLLAEKKPIATPAHVNSEMGVAQWLIQKLKNEPADSTRILIVEMGAYRIGEITLLCEIAQPTIGVITYVGKQHLSLFGSTPNIVQAKGELFEALPANGHAFANRDNDACDALLRRVSCPVTTVGTDHRAAVRALDIEETGKGLRFRTFDTTFDSPLPGTHSLVGTLMAISVTKFLGIKSTDIAQRLKSFRPPERTFEVKEIGKTTVLDDSYNSSPDSVRAAIAWAAGQTKQPKILLMEGIIELGEAEERLHRELAADAARVFDDIFVTHPRYLPYFKDAFGARAHLASEGSTVKDGSLLVLSGRLSEVSKRRFLPSS